MSKAGKLHLVGGAVRDRLLGRIPSFRNCEKDWLVTEANPQVLLSAGYRQVNALFPVFLHPLTREEYSLARKEKSTGYGHKDFSLRFGPEVTVKEDVKRRDFTINTLSLQCGSPNADEDAGESADEQSLDSLVASLDTAFSCQLVQDSCGGIRDIKDGIVRVVGPHFDEDPLRVLRGLRFSASLYSRGFKLILEAKLRMQKILDTGSLETLPSARRWQEVAKALMSTNPEIFFDLFTEISIGIQRQDKLNPKAPKSLDKQAQSGYLRVGKVQMSNRVRQGLQAAAKGKLSLSQRFSTLGLAPSKELLEAWIEWTNPPKKCVQLGRYIANYGQKLTDVQKLTAHEKLELLEKADAIRRPELFNEAVGLMAELAGFKKGSKVKDSWQLYLNTVLDAKLPSKYFQEATNATPKEINKLQRKVRLTALNNVRTD